MRATLGLLLLSGCATAPATLKDAPVEAVPAPVSAVPPTPACPTAAVTFSEGAPAPGAMVAKVCLVGASEDSYLRLHELVAPREGAPLDAAAVQSDIEQLFEQGLLRDVVVIAQPLASKDVVLSYVVTEYEWLSGVELSGATAVKTQDLQEIAHAGVRAHPFVLKTLRDRILAVYAGLGYPRAKVVSTVKSLGGGNAALALEIDEGPQVKVGAITFEGARQVAEPELRKALRTVVGAPYLDELIDRDALALTTVYFDHGLVNVAVVKTTRPLAGAEVELVFQVKEGEVFRLGKLTLTGFSLGPEKELLKTLESKPRSVFSRSVLQRDIERLRARAKLRGYLVEVTPLTSVDSDKKTIDVAFELQKRPGGSIQF